MIRRLIPPLPFFTILLAGTFVLQGGELIYSSKSGNLRNDSLNALVGQYVYQQTGSVDRLRSDWATEISAEPWGAFFDQAVSDLEDSLGQLSGQDAETAINGWANDPANFDEAGAWVYAPPPNLTPIVENVTALQRPGTKLLDIYYDLAVADNHSCTIIVKWSTDNGETFPLTATAVEGHAGPGIIPGQALQITWDMETDWDNQFTQTGRVKVVAARDPIDMETGDSSETGGTSGSGGTSETGGTSPTGGIDR